MWLDFEVGQNRYGRKIIVDLNTVQVEEIVHQYNKFFEICSSYGDSVKGLILECPYYSISIWNSVQGHPNPSIFDQNNLILHHKINELNQNIKELNSTYGVQVPRFSCDMIKTRKLKKSYPTNPSIFDQNNLILHHKINELNQNIKELNSTYGVQAPRFSCDMIKTRKLKKSYPTKTVSYSLLKDGIHPGVTLSQYWIRRIVIAVIFKYCY